ncbi:MAG TPA: metal ABC transporter permease [Phycisphaerales bacterium]|nr:metal ABC transporter permease [Phycisphaerales bacterium]
MDRLFEPFTYPFMVEALVVSTLVGVACALISCYLVLKGWSLMGDAISHAVFPGVVIAYVIGWPLGVGAFIAGLLCALATGWIKANSRVKEDTVMGIVFTGLFGLGAVLFTRVQTDSHLNHILYGNLLGIEPKDLLQSGACAGAAVLIVLAKRRDLLVYCFDRAHAQAVGLRPRLLHYLFLCLVAGVIVSALQAVGIILTVAMLITPGCTARLLTDRFDRSLLIAAGSAAAAALVGTYASYFLNGSTGACIVLTQSLIFTAALIFGPKYGLLAGRRVASAARNQAAQA